jgi:hypothetical protein
MQHLILLNLRNISDHCTTLNPDQRFNAVKDVWFSSTIRLYPYITGSGYDETLTLSLMAVYRNGIDDSRIELYILKLNDIFFLFFS